MDGWEDGGLLSSSSSSVEDFFPQKLHSRPNISSLSPFRVPHLLPSRSDKRWWWCREFLLCWDGYSCRAGVIGLISHVGGRGTSLGIHLWRKRNTVGRRRISLLHLPLRWRIIHTQTAVWTISCITPYLPPLCAPHLLPVAVVNGDVMDLYYVGMSFLSRWSCKIDNSRWAENSIVHYSSLL